MSTNELILARPVKTNCYFELLPLDAHGDPWRGVEPKQAAVSPGVPPAFRMKASWTLDGSDGPPPRFCALLLAGTAIMVREIVMNDVLTGTTQLTLNQEVRFNPADK